MEHRFSFAGITWRVILPVGTELPAESVLWQFAAPADAPWDHTLQLHCCRALPEPEGDLLYRDGGMSVWGGAELRMRYEGPEARPIRCIRRQGRDSEVFLLTDGAELVMTTDILSAMESEHRIVGRGGFLLHASWIRWRDRAILFTAPSGTGKSTQAELWRSLRGAELINGDRAAVFSGPVPQVRGIPFSGSSGVGKNEQMPLAAVVYLSQAPRTTIAPLTGFRAFRKLWEGCSVNLWDRADVDTCAENVTRVLERVPMYHLACTPDESAVRALEQRLEEA